MPEFRSLRVDDEDAGERGEAMLTLAHAILVAPNDPTAYLRLAELAHDAGDHGMARDLPLTTIFRGVVPFLLADLARLVVLILFPSLSLWLPGVLGWL